MKFDVFKKVLTPVELSVIFTIATPILHRMPNDIMKPKNKRMPPGLNVEILI